MVPISGPTTSETIDGPFRIKCEAIPAMHNIKAGDPLTVEVTVSNIGQARVYLISASYPIRSWNIQCEKNGVDELFCKNGEEMWKISSVSSCIETGFDPGDALSEKLILSDFFDISVPGTYNFIITKYWSKTIAGDSDYSATSATIRVVVRN